MAHVDVVRESAGAGRVVLWEESARDGAQAKTLMTPGFRVTLAREMGRMFGTDGPRHVVFAAGFPAVCGEEFEAGVPLTVTTPIVGTGVGSISTGTPFVHPALFQPFDPEEVLDIPPRVVLTHLASARVVTAVATRLGHALDADRNRAAMTWVKERAYRTGRAVIDDTAFADYLDGLTHPTDGGTR
ncbi:hypothetical protein ACH4M4_37320 [Streptomyces sp. NPDC017254]|uniref:hypothetical protein n=1 Tax=unclassified Streptomyces TaxID=2593676 RepID=UPI00379FE1F4